MIVIGSSGFIGRAVMRRATETSLAAIGVARSFAAGEGGDTRHVQVGDYTDVDSLARAAVGCDAAIVLAGRAHVRDDRESHSEAAFNRANRDLPLAVARALATAGGRRLVFVSSIAVNGTATFGTPFRADDPPAPVNAYGRSKLAGEHALLGCCGDLDLELVIVRPPLVYGPAAPGNFGRLLRLTQAGVPLPLAAVHNRRDFIGRDNLADLLLLCARHDRAAGRTFLASDGETVSTASLVAMMYRAAGRNDRSFTVPLPVLRMMARLARRSEEAQRLLDDLQVDSNPVRELLGWRPPLALADGIRQAVQGSRS